MMGSWRQFAPDESGVTAIEYSLIAGLVAIVIVGGVTIMGNSLNAFYSTLAALLAAIP